MIKICQWIEKALQKKILLDTGEVYDRIFLSSIIINIFDQNLPILLMIKIYHSDEIQHGHEIKHSDEICHFEL